MGQSESPNPILRGPTCSPIVGQSWKKRFTLRSDRESVTAVLVGLLICFIIFIDMSYGVIVNTVGVQLTLFWYIECFLLVLVLLGVAFDVLRYLSHTLFGKQVEVTLAQKRLLGVRDSDPGFTLSPIKSRSPACEQSLVFSNSPSSHTIYSPSSSPWGSPGSHMTPTGSHLTPTNLGFSSANQSYAASPTGSSFMSGTGHVSFDRSGSVPTGTVGHTSFSSNTSYSPGLPYSPGMSLPSLDGSGVRSRLSMSFRSPSPSDNITDLQSLSVYLKEQEEKEYRAAFSSQDMTMNTSSFWNYGRPSLDYSHMARRNQYQLASRSPQSHKSRSDDIDNMGEEVWRPLGVMDDHLYLWFERLRKWLGNTIMMKLSREIDNINSQLRKIGSEDTEIGEVGVSTLKQLALLKGSYVPTLNIMVPYLDFSSNQEYLVKRIKDLGSDGCLSEFSWSSGARYGKTWGEHLPTDASLVMHMFCTYLDTRLPPDLRYPDGKTFTSQHFLKTPDKPNLEKDNLLIYQSTINPPHFQVVIKDTVYNLPKGRNNMFHTILFFIYHIKYKENGMLGRVNLGMSGVNLLCVLDS